METTKKTEEKYFQGVGRRKTAIARVRLIPATKQTYLINDKKDLHTYFPLPALGHAISRVFSESGITQKFNISAHIIGGGVASQAEALRHGIARSLIEFDPTLRKNLKTEGFLTRDAREKERRKFGLKKARKAPQWSKR